MINYFFLSFYRLKWCWFRTILLESTFRLKLTDNIRTKRLMGKLFFWNVGKHNSQCIAENKIIFYTILCLSMVCFYVIATPWSLNRYFIALKCWISNSMTETQEHVCGSQKRSRSCFGWWYFIHPLDSWNTHPRKSMRTSLTDQLLICSCLHICNNHTFQTKGHHMKLVWSLVSESNMIANHLRQVFT